MISDSHKVTDPIYKVKGRATVVFSGCTESCSIYASFLGFPHQVFLFRVGWKKSIRDRALKAEVTQKTSCKLKQGEEWIHLSKQPEAREQEFYPRCYLTRTSAEY